MLDYVSIYKTLWLKEALLYENKYNILWASGFKITENLLDRCLEIAEQRLGEKVKIVMGPNCQGASMDLFFPPRDDGHQRLSVSLEKKALSEYPLPKYIRTYWESVTVFKQLKENMFFLTERGSDEQRFTQMIPSAHSQERVYLRSNMITKSYRYIAEIIELGFQFNPLVQEITVESGWIDLSNPFKDAK